MTPPTKIPKGFDGVDPPKGEGRLKVCLKGRKVVVFGFNRAPCPSKTFFFLLLDLQGRGEKEGVVTDIKLYTCDKNIKICVTRASHNTPLGF